MKSLKIRTAIEAFISLGSITMIIFLIMTSLESNKINIQKNQYNNQTIQYVNKDVYNWIRNNNLDSLNSIYAKNGITYIIGKEIEKITHTKFSIQSFMIIKSVEGLENKIYQEIIHVLNNKTPKEIIKLGKENKDSESLKRYNQLFGINYSL